jgi:hypothetical protein
MSLRIRPLETPGSQRDGYSHGSNALELAPEVTLRFGIETDDVEDLEALRHARRSMLREERTRGRDGEEPSLEDAVFSPAEVSWTIRPEQREWCLQKIGDLVGRAYRATSELQIR